MTFKNFQRGIVALNKGHPQDLSHILFIGKVLPLITPRCYTMNPINYYRSYPAVVSSGMMCLCSSALLNILQHGLVEKDA